MDYTEGLSNQTTNRVKSKVEQIADENVRSVRSICALLAEIRELLKEDSNWVAFCASGELGWSSRTVMDYASAHSWLSETAVEDKVLGRMSVRALSMLAGLKAKDEDAFNRLEKRMLNGEWLSQNDILGATERTNTSEVKGLSKGQLNTLIAQLEEDGNRLRTERDFWKKETRRLESILQLEKAVYDEPEAPLNPVMERVVVANKTKSRVKGRVALPA